MVAGSSPSPLSRHGSGIGTAAFGLGSAGTTTAAAAAGAPWPVVAVLGGASLVVTLVIGVLASIMPQESKDRRDLLLGLSRRRERRERRGREQQRPAGPTDPATLHAIPSQGAMSG